MNKRRDYHTTRNEARFSASKHLITTTLGGAVFFSLTYKYFFSATKLVALAN